MPAPDHRLIDCPKCRLAYDWLERANAQTASTGGGRGAATALDPPPGLTTRLDGQTLQLILPRLTGHGVAMLAVGVTSALAGVAMVLASNLPFAAFLLALGLGFTSAGIVVTFTRRRLTVTPTELRVDRVPFGGASAVIPVRDLQQLAIARTRRGSRQVVYDIELWAQLTEHDLMLVSTRDANLAHYLEQRIELHLRIADDGVEMVVPGAE